MVDGLLDRGVMAFVVKDPADLLALRIQGLRHWIAVRGRAVQLLLHIHPPHKTFQRLCTFRSENIVIFIAQQKLNTMLTVLEEV